MLTWLGKFLNYARSRDYVLLPNWDYGLCSVQLQSIQRKIERFSQYCTNAQTATTTNFSSYFDICAIQFERLVRPISYYLIL